LELPYFAPIFDTAALERRFAWAWFRLESGSEVHQLENLVETGDLSPLIGFEADSRSARIANPDLTSS
jgi:hypothetical protein